MTYRPIPDGPSHDGPSSRSLLAVVLVVAVLSFLLGALATDHRPGLLGGAVPVELRNPPTPPRPAPADVYGPGMCIYTDEAFGSGHIGACPP